MDFPALIATSRLTVRRFVSEDLAALAELYADPVTMESVGGVRSRDQAREELMVLIAGYELAGLGPMAICLGGDLIGRCGVSICQVDGETMFEVSYLIAHAHRGVGFAREAAKAVCEAALAAGAERLVALIHPSHVGSIRVAAAIGMRRRGPAGETDLDLYELVREPQVAGL